MTHRSVLPLCAVLSVLVAGFGIAAPGPSMGSTASAQTVPTGVLTNTPTKMVSGETGTASLTLSQPVSGRITFTEALTPAPAGWTPPPPVYLCLPSQGPCNVTWAAPPGFAGSAIITASWSGGSASTTVPVTRSRYLYTGTWNGTQLPPLTHVVPAPTALTGARAAGQLQQFTTLDPAYACMAGGSVDVFVAPRQFPDTYVAYHPAQGTCPAGTWLFPQAPAIATVPASATTGARITVQGAYPDVRPADAVVQFMGVQRKVGQILSWTPTGIDVSVPTGLLSGRYTLTLAWHDPLTAQVVSSAATPVSLQINGQVLPAIPTAAARVLDQATLSKLAPLPSGPISASAPIIFTGSTPILQGLQPNDVLVAGPSPSRPEGLLRKVTSVSPSGNGMAVYTAPATLQDVLKQGSFDVGEALTSQTVQSITPLRSGVSLLPAAPGCDGINVGITGVRLYADDAGNRLVADGNICLYAHFDASAYIGLTSGVSVTATVGDAAHVHLTGKGTYEFHTKVPLLTAPLPPIVFSIGPIPVVLEPEITFNVGADGKIAASVSMGVTQQASFTVSAGCHVGLDTGCDASADSTNSFTPDPVSFNGNGAVTDTGYPLLNADVTGYASIEPTLMLYGAAGAGLEIQGYAEGVAGTTYDPWWTLYAGLKLNATFEMNVWLLDGIHESWTLVDWRTVIDQAAGPLAPPTLQLTVSPQTTPTHPAMCTVVSGTTSVRCPSITLKATLTSALGPLQGKVDFLLLNENNYVQTTRSCTTDASGTCQVAWTPNAPIEYTSYTITARDASGVLSQPVEFWLNTNAPSQ